MRRKIAWACVAWRLASNIGGGRPAGGTIRKTGKVTVIWSIGTADMQLLPDFREILAVPDYLPQKMDFR